jgi:hypothetical protein
VRLVVARVPELVWSAGWNADPLAGAGDELLAADLEADRSAEDLEALLLARVDVRGRDEAARLDEGLEDDCLPARLARRLAEDEALAVTGFSIESPAWIIWRSLSRLKELGAPFTVPLKTDLAHTYACGKGLARNSGSWGPSGSFVTGIRYR